MRSLAGVQCRNSALSTSPSVKAHEESICGGTLIAACVFGQYVRLSTNLRLPSRLTTPTAISDRLLPDKLGKMYKVAGGRAAQWVSLRMRLVSAAAASVELKYVSENPG
jgi:hypothetical protein